MQNHTIKLTPPADKPMPIVIPSYNGARKQANLTPLLAILLHKLGFPVVVHGVSEDPTRVLTETIFELMGITPTFARRAGAGEARRTSTGVYACRRVLPAAGKTTGDALADGRA
ncbi:putative glycosyl transferase [Escherichia coli]|uniref:Putative glycosyl transferase n=1 Tax=Escherichia coli TaxID=562 RepID=A0A376VNH5_ECOLX|nr:putative glycosyl transferase [Escherichia coli]